MTVEELTSVPEPASPGPPVPAVSRAEYVPKGKGPEGYELMGRWTFLEAGKGVRLRTIDGGQFQGTVKALSRRAILLENGEKVFVEDVVEMERVWPP
jgi:hypothetical protein